MSLNRDCTVPSLCAIVSHKVDTFFLVANVHYIVAKVAQVVHIIVSGGLWRFKIEVFFNAKVQNLIDHRIFMYF